MSFLDLAKKRCSVRSYEDKPVEKEKLIEVIEAARIAPSAVNYQPWHFIVIDDPVMKEKLRVAYPRKWFANAPAVIVACGDHSKSWRRADGKDHCDIDLAIAMDHMTLAAADSGLGTCWVCAFNSTECHKILELPSHMEVVALLPIGYPANKADINRHNEKRQKIEEIMSWNHL